MLTETLYNDKVKFMKSGLKNRVTAINFIFTDLDTKKGRSKGAELTDKDVVKSIESEVDKQREAVKFSKDSQDTSDREDIIKYLEAFIPDKLSEDVIASILKRNGILGVPKNEMGKAMGTAKKIFANEEVDMAVVSKLVRG